MESKNSYHDIAYPFWLLKKERKHLIASFLLYKKNPLWKFLNMGAYQTLSELFYTKS